MIKSDYKVTNLLIQYTLTRNNNARTSHCDHQSNANQLLSQANLPLKLESVNVDSIFVHFTTSSRPFKEAHISAVKFPLPSVYMVNIEACFNAIITCLIC